MQETLTKLELKVNELEPRISKLEDDYSKDIKHILELLQKIF